jgi:hypothetical protein
LSGPKESLDRIGLRGRQVTVEIGIQAASLD